MQIIINADLWELENRIKNKEVGLDLILDHSKGRWTAIDNNIPIDTRRFSHLRPCGTVPPSGRLICGAMWLAEQMANTLFTDMEYKRNKEWLLNVW